MGFAESKFYEDDPGDSVVVVIQSSSSPMQTTCRRHLAQWLQLTETRIFEV
jgi:hypothetical protein